MRPDRSLGLFHERNIAVHGIRFGQVREAPTWDQVFDLVSQLAGTDPLVAHNVGFDRSAMRAVCDLYGLLAPANPWACTLRLSRKLLPHTKGHRLPEVTTELGIDAFTHHDALDDARAAARDSGPRYAGAASSWPSTWPTGWAATASPSSAKPSTPGRILRPL